METCPCCGEWMKFNMDYISGTVFIYYTCKKCGYDERDEMQTTASTKTEYIKRNN